MAATIRDLSAEAATASVDACGHAHAELVGLGGEARYLRCGCGVMLVVQRGRMWILRPVPT